ncbi:MAG TPA: urease accessory protein UreD [Burkholderiales bacterium]
MVAALSEPRDVHRDSWHGRLDVGFTRSAERTLFERRRVQMPLALQRPFYPEGPSVCHVLLLHPPGGMVGGDRLDISFELDTGAEALVSTPSAAKWYRGLRPAYQDVRHRLAGGAHFEWLPQETIVFSGADVHQRLRVELGAQASWFGWEITRFGRSARGETFDEGTWCMDTEVWREGSPLWIDRQRLDGGSRMLTSAYGLGGAPVIATLAWVGVPVAAEIVDAARALWLSERLEGDAGVTRLAHGMLCRYRGSSSAAARAWFIAVWDKVRSQFRGAAACTPRIWRT